ncbi:hypothetical protein J7K50_01840 [bacterium]|nr:hypothetical protein [bacterium]
MSIERTKPFLKVMHGERGIEVDSSLPRKELSIVQWYDRLEIDDRIEKSNIEKGIEKIVSEGNAIGAIEIPGDPIPDIAAQRLDQYNEDHTLQLGFIPSTPPSITVKFSPTRFQFDPGVLSIRYGDKFSGVDITA